MNVRLPLTLLLTLTAAELHAQTIAPRHVEGRLRGFLVVRNIDGRQIGYGEFSESAHGDKVTTRMVYRLRDGSLDDETTVFSPQQNSFKFISDHHVQRGPSFPHPLDLTTNAEGDSTSRSVDSDGKPKVETSHLDLPEGTAVVGMIGTLMANLDPATPSLKVAGISPTPKPRLLHFAKTPEHQGTFHIAGSRQTAAIFRVKVDLGGIASIVAPIVGNQPDDSIIWVLEGESPTLVRVVTQLAEGGPLLDIQLAGATFPRFAK